MSFQVWIQEGQSEIERHFIQIQIQEINTKQPRLLLEGTSIGCRRGRGYFEIKSLRLAKINKALGITKTAPEMDRQFAKETISMCRLSIKGR
jgi:hypothetical protein